MKKIVYILVSLMILAAGSFAQQKPADKTKPTSKNTVAAKPIAPKTTSAKPAETKAPVAAKTKKDGTPDMRYKENKEAAKPAPKLKKDGTPDMRYKANKDAAKKK